MSLDEGPSTWHLARMRISTLAEILPRLSRSRMSLWTSSCQRHVAETAYRNRSLSWQAPPCQKRHSYKRTSRRFVLRPDVVMSQCFHNIFGERSVT